jgi:RNA polymerase sigma-70 factor (ECF subfamily)
MTHPDGFEQWDGAYVLGALSTADRHAYEDHLADCPACRAAIAELAVLPGLLGAIEPDSLPALLEAHEDPDAPRDLLPDVQQPAHRVRRRHSRRTAAALGAAASTLLLAPLLSTVAESPVLTAQLSPAAGSRLSAEARLTAEPWGAQIALDCHYPSGPAAWPTAEYGLYLTDARGHVTLLSTWEEGPGSTAHVLATAATPVSDVARLDVRKADSGAVVLATPIPSKG